MRDLTTEPQLIADHAFEVNPKDDFRCAKCGASRALHKETDFVPSKEPERIAMDERTRYRTQQYD